MTAAFIGREHQRRVLETAAEAACAGRGRLVLVSGEAGIGKTALVDHVVRRLTDMTVAWGSAHASEHAAPLRPWRTALRTLLRSAGRDVDDTIARAPALSGLLMSAAPAAASRADMHEATIDLLEELAAARPLVLVFDDLQWAGEDTISLLNAVAGEVGRARMLVVGTVREEESPASLDGLRCERLPLGGLSPVEVAVLADTSEEHAAGLVARTGGNPLFVLEVGRLEAAGRGGELPTTVRSVLAARVAALPAEGRGVLEAAAVLGEEFDLTVAHAVAGVLDVDAVTAAVEQRLVVPAPGAILRHRFAHDLVREAVLADVPDAERAHLESRAADVLAERGSNAARVAHHLRRAVAGIPHLALAASEASARAALEAERTLAWDSARDEWHHALDLAAAAGAPAPDRLALQLAHAAALGRTGRTDEARAEHIAAAAIAEELGDGRSLALAALGIGGGLGGFEVPMHDAEQVALLRRALAGLDDPVLRVHVLARLSVALTFIAEVDERLRLADQAVAEASTADDAIALASALAARSDALADPDHLDERIAMATRMRSLADSADGVEHLLLALRFLVLAHLEAGNLGDASAAVDGFEREARRLGQARHRWYVPLWRSSLAAADGDTDRALALNAEARRTGERGGSTNAWILTTSQWLLQLVERGEADLAREHTRQVTEENPEIHGPQTGLAWMEALCGNHGIARAYLDREVASRFSRIPRDAEWLSLMAILLETAAVVRHRAALEVLLEMVEPYLTHHAVDGIGDAYLGVLGGVAAHGLAALGERARAEATYRDAITAQDAAGGRRRAAHWRVGLADLVRPDDPAAAADLEREALELDPNALVSYRLPRSPSQETTVERRRASLTREGDVWALSFDGRTIRVRATRGVAMLAVLLARAGQEIAAVELDGGSDVSGSTGPALDETARRAYKRRIVDLEQELDDADACNDLGRAERARVELDALVEELRRAFGLGGAPRATGAADRARMRVTKAVRAAIDRIDRDLPELGRHLDVAIRTGVFCSYTPDPSSSIQWTLDVESSPE